MFIFTVLETHILIRRERSRHYVPVKGQQQFFRQWGGHTICHSTNTTMPIKIAIWFDWSERWASIWHQRIHPGSLVTGFMITLDWNDFNLVTPSQQWLVSHARYRVGRGWGSGPRSGTELQELRHARHGKKRAGCGGTRQVVGGRPLGDLARSGFHITFFGYVEVEAWYGQIQPMPRWATIHGSILDFASIKTTPHPLPKKYRINTVDIWFPTWPLYC